MDILSDWIMSSPTAPGVDRIYLPGEIEWETRARREADGVPVEEETWARRPPRVSLVCPFRPPSNRASRVLANPTARTPNPWTVA
ncbi:hypothetical protein HN371_26340 [Candidatus Poribacteria bacterium]|jgi:hypothetical protein|nr:hypothetical protein [Candidatus Poribacteria bacterium]MBT5711241.1 hypothetical protein [Candidatus Poribacteria bacterium]MBT7098821.1 hypothetical protein [Candidatus Poribacteria bacterium]MBT7804618.1 hypothetical protein [Candidatus Poribacteria bacterium]